MIRATDNASPIARQADDARSRPSDVHGQDIPKRIALLANVRTRGFIDTCDIPPKAALRRSFNGPKGDGRPSLPSILDAVGIALGIGVTKYGSDKEWAAKYDAKRTKVHLWLPKRSQFTTNTMSLIERQQVADFIHAPFDEVWPYLQAPKNVAAVGTVSSILATAQAFRIAIDALPVGKDIRTRLNGHLDAHIAAIEAMLPGGAK